MWLNDKEEEEVNFDWSDRNTNMTAKKDNYSVGFWCLSTHPVDFLFRYMASREKHDFTLINIFLPIFQGLMRELELREKKVNDIQAIGDKLVRDGHPGKKTVEVISLVNPAEFHIL